MREAKQKLGFVGFTFNGIHSSQFGLYSVTSGGRYARQMLPNSEDITLSVEGGNGSYFFGSKDKEKTFKLDLAFMDMTEQEYTEMITWLRADGVPKALILDERPYVQYYVKLSKEPQIKFVPFDYENFGRIYKGELELEFKAYDPYGYSVHKFLNEYVDEDPYSIGEWAEGSRLLGNNINNELLVYDVPYVNNYMIYIPLINNGDMPTDFILNIPIGPNYSDYLYIYLDGIEKMSINLTAWGTEVGILSIDSKKQAIFKNGIIANNLLGSGGFFPVPIGIHNISLNVEITNYIIQPNDDALTLEDLYNLQLSHLDLLIAADFNEDGRITEDYEFALMTENLNKTIAEGADPRCDLSGDGNLINFTDQSLLVDALGYVNKSNGYILPLLAKGDLNNDNKVDVLDYNLVLADYNQNVENATTPAADLNEDGVIEFLDLSAIDLLRDQALAMGFNCYYRGYDYLLPGEYTLPDTFTITYSYKYY